LSILHLIFAYYVWSPGIYLTKPLLIPLLIHFFLSSTKDKEGKFRIYILGALIFSWVGDLWLMGNGSLHFLLGLGGFFIAQLFYILAFGQRNIPKENKSLFFDFILVFPLLIYFVFLLLDLIPNMMISEEYNGLVTPVIIYGATLTIMAIRATTRYQRTNKTSYIYILVGAVLFLASDSLIAFDKFSSPIEMARVYIMLTYLSAQFLIAKGAVEFYRED
jgi:uncharacterized membrane protein YhhN